jgi:hypothetical protein
VEVPAVAAGRVWPVSTACAGVRRSAWGSSAVPMDAGGPAGCVRARVCASRGRVYASRPVRASSAVRTAAGDPAADVWGRTCVWRAVASARRTARGRSAGTTGAAASVGCARGSSSVRGRCVSVLQTVLGSSVAPTDAGGPVGQAVRLLLRVWDGRASAFPSARGRTVGGMPAGGVAVPVAQENSVWRACVHASRSVRARTAVPMGAEGSAGRVRSMLIAVSQVTVRVTMRCARGCAVPRGHCA